MPRNPPHDGTIDLLKATLPGLIPSGWLLRIQQTLVLSDSLPEPDFAVVRGTLTVFTTAGMTKYWDGSAFQAGTPPANTYQILTSLSRYISRISGAGH